MMIFLASVAGFIGSCLFFEYMFARFRPNSDMGIGCAWPISVPIVIACWLLTLVRRVAK